MKTKERTKEGTVEMSLSLLTRKQNNASHVVYIILDNHPHSD